MCWLQCCVPRLGIDAARAAVSPVTALATLISLPTPARDQAQICLCQLDKVRSRKNSEFWNIFTCTALFCNDAANTTLFELNSLHTPQRRSTQQQSGGGEEINSCWWRLHEEIIQSGGRGPCQPAASIVVIVHNECFNLNIICQDIYVDMCNVDCTQDRSPQLCLHSPCPLVRVAWFQLYLNFLVQFLLTADCGWLRCCAAA